MANDPADLIHALDALAMIHGDELLEAAMAVRQRRDSTQRDTHHAAVRFVQGDRFSLKPRVPQRSIRR